MQVSVNNGHEQNIVFLGRYTLGDKLQQHVAATDHSMWRVGLLVAATRWGDTSQRQIASCVQEKFWENLLSPQQNFVVATNRKKSNQTEFVRLVAATKFFCSNKDFHKNPPVRTERFVAADVLPRRVGTTCHLACTDHAFILFFNTW